MPGEIFPPKGNGKVGRENCRIFDCRKHEVCEKTGKCPFDRTGMTQFAGWIPKEQFAELKAFIESRGGEV